MKYISKCPITNKIVGMWTIIPGFYNLKGQFIRYEIGYYCNYNKTIHKSRKDYLNCKHCKQNKLLTD